jgi:transposase InsO family protein
MDQRREFARLALQDDCNFRELCRRFEISPPTGYKWLGRWKSGEHDLGDRSRRPHTSPRRATDTVEAKVIAVRDAHPAWGPRKIGRFLERKGVAVPSRSTVQEILRRHGRIDPAQSLRSKPLTRFEKQAPNLLWQMDFKGWIGLLDGTRCFPLTVVDDHSRYVPCLKACGDQQTQTVKDHLETTFHRYGLPDAFYVDNGPPWGDSSGTHWTRLAVWLLKLGVEVIYAKPCHPQGRGKNERFHRTLDQEVFALERFAKLAQVQRALDAWREVYNFERPHDGIGLDVPADRYRPSPRSMPNRLPQVQYDAGQIVRTVPSSKDYISFRGQFWKVPQAFRGERVAIRPLSADGRFGVYFASHQIATIDCRLSPAL